MIIIDDDFLEKSEVESFYSLLTTDDSRAWTFTRLVSKNVDAARNIYKINNWSPSEYFQFVTAIDPSNQNDPVSFAATKILQTFCIKHKISLSKIVRGKINMTWPSEDDRFAPHIDTTEPHLIFLYYVNDSDGETIIFDKMYSDSPEYRDISNDVVIRPKAGRAVVFDARMFHTPLSPSSGSMRFALNFVFVP